MNSQDSQTKGKEEEDPLIQFSQHPEAATSRGGFLESNPSMIVPFLNLVLHQHGTSRAVNCCGRMFSLAFPEGQETEANSGICGKLWKPGDPAYKCITCEADPTCALCIECFKNGNHEGHDFRMITTGGGCCDCGDPEAWNRDGFCKFHPGPPGLDFDPTENLPEESKNAIRETFVFLLNTLIDNIIGAGADYSFEGEDIKPRTPRDSNIESGFTYSPHYERQHSGFSAESFSSDESESSDHGMIQFDGLEAGGDAVSMELPPHETHIEPNEEYGAEDFQEFLQSLFPHGNFGAAINDLLNNSDEIFSQEPQPTEPRIPPSIAGLLGRAGMGFMPTMPSAPPVSETELKRHKVALAVTVALRAATEKSIVLHRILGQALVGPDLADKKGFDIFKKPEELPFRKHPLLAQIMVINNEIGFSVFKNDKHLGDSLSKLFFKMNTDFWFKIKFALLFVLYYNDCFKHSMMRLMKDKHPDFDNDIQGFSVQILTIQSVVPKLVKFHGLLSQLFKAMNIVFGKAKNTRNLVDANHVLIKQRLYFRVTHDIEYAVLQKCISHYIVRENPEMLVDWIRMLKSLQGMGPIIRALKTHVMFEDNSYRHSHQLELDMMKPMTSLLLSLEDEWTSDMLDIKPVSEEEQPNTIMDQEPHSIHDVSITVARVLSLFLRSILEHRTGNNRHVASRLSLSPLFNGFGEVDEIFLPICDPAYESVSFHCPLTRATVYAIAIACSNSILSDVSSVGEILLPDDWEGVGPLSELVDMKDSFPSKRRNPDNQPRDRVLQELGFALIDEPLTERVLDAQIRAGMWKRNGESMRIQLRIIEFTGIRHRVINLDIAALQIATCLVGADTVVLTILHRFGLFDWFSIPILFDCDDEESYMKMLAEYDETRQKPPFCDGRPGPEVKQELTEHFLKLLIQVVSERTVIGDFSKPQRDFASEFDQRNPHHKDSGEPERSRFRRLALLRYELIHKLVLGSATHSELKDCATVGLCKDESELHSALEDIATYSRSSSDKAGLYRLKKEIWSEYYPYYSFYTPANARTAEENYFGNVENAEFLRLPDYLVPVLPAFSKMSESFATSRILIRIIHALVYQTRLPLEEDLMLEDSVISEGSFTKLMHLLSRVVSIHRELKLPALFLLWPEGRPVTDTLDLSTVPDSSILGHLLAIQDSMGEKAREFYARKELAALIKSLILECQSSLPKETDEYLSGVFSQPSLVANDSELNDGDEADKRKEMAAKRRAQIMADFQTRQSKFVDSNDDAKSFLEKDRSTDFESGVTFQCVLCQESAKSSTENPICYVGYLQSTELLGLAATVSPSLGLSIDSTKTVPTKHEVFERISRSLGATKSRLIAASESQQSEEDPDIIPFDSLGSLCSSVDIDAGVVSQFCGHTVHSMCFDRYTETLRRSRESSNRYEGEHTINVSDGEFLCPGCRRPCNTLVPVLVRQEGGEGVDGLMCVRQHQYGAEKSGEITPNMGQILPFLESVYNNAEEFVLNGFKVPLAYQFSDGALSRAVRNLVHRNFCVEFHASAVSDFDPTRGPTRTELWCLDSWNTVATTIAHHELSVRHLAYLDPSTPADFSLVWNSSQIAQIRSFFAAVHDYSWHILSESKISGYAKWLISILLGQEKTDTIIPPVVMLDAFSLMLRQVLTWRGIMSENVFDVFVGIYYSVAIVQSSISAFREGSSDGILANIAVPFLNCFSSGLFSVSVEKGGNVGFLARFWDYLLPFLRRMVLLRRLCFDSLPVISTSITIPTCPHEQVPRLLEELHLSPPQQAIQNHPLIPSWTRHFAFFISSRKEALDSSLVVRMSPYRPFALLDLPENFLDLWQFYIEDSCKRCGTVPNQPGLCLQCGTFICIGGNCCVETAVRHPGFRYQPVLEENGEAQLHARECGSGTTAYIILKHTGTLLVSSGRSVLWNSLYADEWGEEDPGFQRGRPLHLNKLKVRTLLWLFCNYQLDTEIVNLSLTQNLRVYSRF